ncbi:cupin domain-containing protein [Simiduia sp. 21SJ11W-1]|uniref:cupin domain-containing protein n=1 Tax=Simiduia sp. 21SJ11W-1 TaxID=2909669 RepID=UPI0020A144E7|nr:cupin domain-containing protein [Simiduia sp. 21SJ11W-1]UTA47245.1 cupin domain-containing protein [Simiduia sp. 21SJ11W-1]
MNILALGKSVQGFWAGRLLAALLASGAGFSQLVYADEQAAPVTRPTPINLHAITPSTRNPLEVVPLASDANASQFLIFIANEVRPHKHLTHTETIYVLAGRGEMRVGDQRFVISAGDFVQVPVAAVHGVKVLSAEPLKVLSVQAPEFTGADRVWVED